MNNAILAMTFQREHAGVELFESVLHLLVPYFREVASHQDLELAPDFEQYHLLEKAGILRVYTARMDGKVVGFSALFVNHHLHTIGSKQAVQDLLYVDPDHRGFGLSFIKWCDDQLVQEGVDVVYRAMHALRDFTPVMKRMGYELTEQVYARRL
jgi:GNAT superfamily N-acetyltransferase